MPKAIQISSRFLQRQFQARTVRTLSVTSSDMVSKVNVLCQTYRRIESSKQGFWLLNTLKSFRQVLPFADLRKSNVAKLRHYCVRVDTGSPDLLAFEKCSRPVRATAVCYRVVSDRIADPLR